MLEAFFNQVTMIFVIVQKVNRPTSTTAVHAVNTTGVRQCEFLSPWSLLNMPSRTCL